MAERRRRSARCDLVGLVGVEGDPLLLWCVDVSHVGVRGWFGVATHNDSVSIAIPTPASRPNLDDYPHDERPRYYRDLDAWWAGTVGLELLARVGERLDDDLDPSGLGQFCSECCASGSPLGEPVRGLDSHRDCASDGNTVWWARPAAQPDGEAAPDVRETQETVDAPEAQPETVSDPWPPQRWVRLPEGALSRLVEREPELLEMQSLLRRSRDSETDRYFARLVGGQLAAVDTALEIVAALREQAKALESCEGWSHNSTTHIQMCGNCSQPRRDHGEASEGRR